MQVVFHQQLRIAINYTTYIYLPTKSFNVLYCSKRTIFTSLYLCWLYLEKGKIFSFDGMIFRVLSSRIHIYCMYCIIRIAVIINIKCECKCTLIIHLHRNVQKCIVWGTIKNKIIFCIFLRIVTYLIINNVFLVFI